MDHTIQAIWKLRHDKQNPRAASEAFDAALGMLEGELRNKQPDVNRIFACWHEHFAGTSCLLLEFARETWRAPAEQTPQFKRLKTIEGRLEVYLPRTLRLLRIRRDLLSAINQPSRDVAALIKSLRQAAVDYAPFFAVSAVSDPPQAAATRPAFVGRLPDKENWHRVFAAVMEDTKLGWRHPGVLTVGETVCQVYGERQASASDHVVQTWILLADQGAPNGALARLRLRRLDGGCGGLFPDPLAAGYTRLDETFRAGLLRAWTAAFQAECPKFDVAWSLEFIDAPYNRRHLPISGPSAEAAVCCALRALKAGDRIDQRVAITATLAAPDGTATPLGPVGPVGAINKKTLPPSVRLEKITEILVARHQPEISHNGGDEVVIGNGEIRLIPVADVDQAYQKLTCWERITSCARQQLAAAASARIHELCGHYVVPTLLRPVVERTRQHALRDAAVPPEQEEPYDPLTPDEVVGLLGGTLPYPRTLLLAHSGLGKSVMLLECQKRMAERPGGPLLVLLEGLSQFPWQNPPLVRQRIADSLTPYLPNGVKEAERWAWFERLVEVGKVVFLLDALDQTIVDKLDGMSGFLANNICDCRVLMTGRPYVIHTRGGQLDTSWTELRLDKFNKTQQREFLGEWAAGVLETEEERELSDELETEEEREQWWEFEQSIARKRQWADLVDQPLLLKLLRGLAIAENLRDVRNRYDIYHRAVEQLIDKGWESLQKSESEPIFQSSDEPQEMLSQIAWNRAQAGDFRGVVDGKELTAVMKAIAGGRPEGAKRLQKALDQMGVVTCGGIVESERVARQFRLVWRHPTLSEYFAGLELAQQYPRQRMMSPTGGPTWERQPENEYAAAVRENARSADWRSVFRFALSTLARSASEGTNDDPRSRVGLVSSPAEQLAALAADLIQCGNPFVVAQAIGEDGVQLPSGLDRLCRWLVHRDSESREAWTDKDQKPEVDLETVALLDSAFVLQRRDSRYLHAAWELVSQSELELTRSICARFLAEFPNLLASGNPVAIAIRDGFREIPPPDDPLRKTMRFAVGVAEDEEKHSFEKVDRRDVSLAAPFEIARTPVTNAQFELFALEHRDRRTNHSKLDDCPVVELSWFEAELYCVWLGGFGGGEPCRLPTEIEWEIACRAGSAEPYCRIRESDGTLRDLATEDDLRRVAHFGSEEGTVPVASKQANAWGLHDMLGNVWEWCADWLMPDAYNVVVSGDCRMIRGGHWILDARSCRSAARNGSRPRNRLRFVGFRLARSSVE